MRFCGTAKKQASAGAWVIRRKVPGSAPCLKRRKNSAEAFHFHHGQRKSQAGGRRHDRAQSVETPWCLAHRLRARHPDSDGVENVWNDEEQTTEGVVTTVGKRTCPTGASEGGNESGGGPDAMTVKGAGVTVKLLLVEVYRA